MLETGWDARDFVARLDAGEFDGRFMGGVAFLVAYASAARGKQPSSPTVNPP
jgi:hypothetical protein